MGYYHYNVAWLSILIVLGDNKIKYNKVMNHKLVDTSKNKDFVICFYCKSVLNDDQITEDHIIPLHYLNKNNIAIDKKYNLIKCCKECNTLKSHLCVSDFNKILHFKEIIKQSNENINIIIAENKPKNNIDDIINFTNKKLTINLSILSQFNNLENKENFLTILSNLIKSNNKSKYVEQLKDFCKDNSIVLEIIK